MNKATEYGCALYELAAEEGLENVIEKEFAEIATVLEQNTDFIKLLSNPRIPISERHASVEQVFGEQVQPYLLSMIKIFTEHRDVSLLPFCYKEYRKKYYKEKNIIQVIVTSSVKLDTEQKQRIISKLEKSTRKTIVLVNKIDKSCIGGIRLEYSGRMIDASIKNRFRKLQQDIRNADYSQAEV